MLLLALLTLPAVLQDPAPEAKAQPAFDAHVVLSKDLGFWDEWSHTVSGHGPKLSSASKVVRGQAWEVFAFTRAYSIDEHGHVELRYDVHITRPDGKSYSDKKDLELFVEDAQTGMGIQLAREVVGVSFDPPDPLGQYVVTIEVRDGVAERKATASAEIELVDYPAPQPFAGEDDLGEWLTGYHLDPDPVRALDAIVAAGKLGWYEDEQANGPVRTFLREVLAEHKFLAPLLLERLPGLEPGARLAGLDILAGTGWAAKEFLEKASNQEREFYERRVKTLRSSPLKGPIRDAMQLDELWAIYFAHGRYEPIERLAQALSLDNQDKAAAGGELMTRVLEQTARWSMGSNLEHARVRAFCEWIIARKVLDAPDAEQLKKLLEE